MNLLLWLLGQGVVISLLVDQLKRFKFVAENPKIVVLVLNLILAAIMQNVLGLGDYTELVKTIAQALLAALTAAGTAVGFYEFKKSG